MDKIRNSISKAKKRLRGKKYKPDGTGTNTPAESVDSSGSLLQPEPRVATSGHDGEGSGTDTGGRQAHSRGRSPQPEPILPGGDDDDQQGRKADVDGKEASQRDLRLVPDVGILAGSRPSQEVERVYSSPSDPSIQPAREPDSM